MDREIKTKWVAALRSGEHRQGQGYLGFEGYKCCLGVLCIVQGIDLMSPPDDGSGDSAWYGSMPIPMDEDLDLAGLPIEDASTLVRMNDGVDGERVHSFHEIADWIESNL